MLSRKTAFFHKKHRRPATFSRNRHTASRHFLPLRLGGRIPGFDMDSKFGNCMDGLVLVDLRETDPKIPARFMGRKQAEQFHAMLRHKRGKVFEPDRKVGLLRSFALGHGMC